jgi:hypothetical protein
MKKHEDHRCKYYQGRIIIHAGLTSQNRGFAMNIEFSYLYRDAGNFKNFGTVVFANKNQTSLEKLNEMIKQRLIDEMYFDAFNASVPSLFFDDYDEELDHDWHEFENVKEVEMPANDSLQRDITTFIKLLADLPK